MARHQSLFFSCIFFVVCVATLDANATTADKERQVYIVYMGALPKSKEYSPSAHHASILQKVVHSSYREQALIRSYTKSFNGFAANLTEEEQQSLAAYNEVVSIFPSRPLELLTTESWDFMGLSLNVKRNLKMEKDVIIGVLDTGIWPESESFNDHGLGPPPKKWKGVCKGGKNFTCNNKIIGARNYGNAADDSARDEVGHGTHTASIAAGIAVSNASFEGIARGTARGGAPSARISIYKVCYGIFCFPEDILAGFDDAIADGVDILTVSLGGGTPLGFQHDTLAIGAFHAATKGVLTVNAAGNSGSSPATTSSVAPWLFSVAASITKRRIISKVGLGDEKNFSGNAVNSFKLNGTNFPLVYGKDAAAEQCDEILAKSCSYHCLDDNKVKGKIVVCDSSDGIAEVKRTRSLGLVTQTGNTYDVSYVLPIPGSALYKKEFELVISYYNSTKNPQASIFTSELAENPVAPVTATFSSRGPNVIIPAILKPDITAPGVDILSAFSPEVTPSGSLSDKRSVKYNVLSGTSMACPHVAGAAAYVKSHHHDWSSSAIKSALMTTAWKMNATNTNSGDAEFSYGAGHIDPVKALDPGLVYETEKMDYVKMLCSMNFDNATLRKIFGDNTTCPEGPPSDIRDLNYPTMAAKVEKDKRFSVKFPRRVTNAGSENSTYKATISQTSQCKITVQPSILSFKALKERKSFVVIITGRRLEDMISASLEWSDGTHFVRSPIVLY